MGSAFSMGCVGGALWHFFKGMRNSPRGYRLNGGYTAVTLRAPTLGGNFAVWGGLFSVFDCSLIHLRGKEDPINAIAAGAATGGLLAARSGMKAIGRNAIIGGALLAMIEGISYLITSKMSPQQPQPVPFMAPTHGPGGLVLPGVVSTNPIGKSARANADPDDDHRFAHDELETPMDDLSISHDFAFDPSEDFSDEL